MNHPQLIKNMTHHAPSRDIQSVIEDLRAAYHKTAHEMDAVVDDGRAKSLAQTKLEESLMWAVKGLVVPGA